MRRFIVSAAGLLIVALLAQAAPPKLVLVISVDQFRYDYLLRFQDSYQGGLARYLTQGAVFTNAHHEHFPTVTAIGHATILTGATPSVHGIVGNGWYDRSSGREITSVSDNSVRLLGAGPGTGSSPKNLAVSTVGDELKQTAAHKSKVIGISMKDRAAILSVGRMADAAYWYDTKTGRFVSSSYYTDELPAWVGEFNDAGHAARFAGRVWKPFGASNGEPFARFATETNSKYFNSLRRSPFANELVAAFARQAIQSEELGRHEGTDLLAVSFSANDYVGHEYGPDAPEVRDISIRTDRLLNELFRFLDSEIGMGHILVLFTADHGVAPLPEVMRQRGMPGGRLPPKAIEKALVGRLSERYGEGKWVLGWSGPAPYLDHELVRDKGLDLAGVRKVAAEAVASIPGVARVYTYDDLAAARIAGDQVDRRVIRGFHSKRGSDLYVVLAPYWLSQAHGTSHGTPHNYDSHVPIMFLGPGIRPGHYHSAAAVNDIAPTLSVILGTELPSGSSGRVLTGMLETN
ncbi:MAG: alkaline phosphatase family protein [bacterium]|nr:alkaline phosphatase family protein [bacterium]